MVRVTCAFAALAIVLAAGPASATVPPARDGEIAIREEFDAARRAGTRAAYEQLIARHPTHPLAEKARAERARLRR
jgi:hypothetical protein